MNPAVSIHAIDALLPQTQCGKCGHPGCRPYAEGIARGEAINKCPPGGEATVSALATLLEVTELPLEQPAVPPQIAYIREAECIGCTKCLQACPVDAIVGAAKLMHTVIRDECTGCELCIAPCPVDCIDILPLAIDESAAQRARADHFRERHEARLARLARDEARRKAERAARLPAVESPPPATARPNAGNEDHKRLKIEAAMAKVVLAKAEKQLAQRGTPALERQVAELRLAADQAQRALDAAAPPAAPAASGDAELKRAKIQLAVCRAELGKAEREGADAERLATLRQALANAENALHAAEAACERPAPALVRTDKRPVDPALRGLKTELAYARAEVSKLERRDPRDETALAEARRRAIEAERQIDGYTSH